MSATLGNFTLTRDPGFHPQAPIAKVFEALGGAGTDEEEIYAVFKEIKELESSSPYFWLEDVAKRFKKDTYVKNLSLAEVLESELSEKEIEKLESIYPNCMDILRNII